MFFYNEIITVMTRRFKNSQFFYSLRIYVRVGHLSAWFVADVGYSPSRMDQLDNRQPLQRSATMPRKWQSSYSSESGYSSEPRRKVIHVRIPTLSSTVTRGLCISMKCFYC